MKELRNRIIKKSLIYCLILSFAGVFIFKEFSLGIILGTGISILNFWLLERQILALVTQKLNLFFGFFGYIIRYLLMAAILFLCFKISRTTFFGAALGLFMVRFAILGEKGNLHA